MIKIKEYRDEYMSIFNQNEEDRQRIERFKNEKLFNEGEVQKGMIGQIEQKLTA